MSAGLTYANAGYRSNLVGNKSGDPLDQALRKLPGNNLSNSTELVATGNVALTPEIGNGGMTGLVYGVLHITRAIKPGSHTFSQIEPTPPTPPNTPAGSCG